MAARLYARGCGCAPAGFAALLKRARRDQSRVQPTRVGAYLVRKSKPLARKIAKTLKAHGKQVAAKASRLYAERLAKDDRPKRNTVAAIVADLDSDDLGEAIEGQLAPAMLAAFRRAAAVGAQQVGLEMDDGVTDQVDAAAVDYAKRRGGELIEDLAGTTDDDLRDLLARAVDEGMSSDELSDAVESMGAFGEGRADMIARTELAFAHVQGNKEGWAQSGVTVQKRSILGDLHNFVDECDDAADAGVVDLDDDFVDGLGDPPYHPFCVCDIEPVLPDEEDDSSDDGGDDAEKMVAMGSLLGAMHTAPAPRVQLAALLHKATPDLHKTVDQAAHVGATSDLNLLRKPTDAQAKAGNYKKGRARVAGLPLTIENAAGSRRRPEWPPLSAHYGYVRGTEGADGDHVDVFVRPGTPDDWDGTVFVVDQTDADGSFDEHKCLIGYDDESTARHAYAANYPAGWSIGQVTALSCEALREWLGSGQTDRPIADAEMAAA